MLFLENFSYFLLVGFVTYSVYSTSLATDNSYTRNVLIGITLGVIGFLFISHPIPITGNDFPVDGSAGPLILAGYLGGPVAAAIAALFGILGQLLSGGPHPYHEASIAITLPFLGVIVGHLRPFQNFHDINKRVILASILGFLILEIILTFLSRQLFGVNIIGGAIVHGTAVATAGVLSIAITSLIIKYSKYWAEYSARTEISSDRFDHPSQSAGLGLFAAVANSDMFYLDRELMAILGLDREGGNVSVEEWMTLIHPEDLDATKAAYDAIWTDTSPAPEHKNRILRPDGKVVFTRSNWFVNRAKNGKVLKITGIMTDITDLQETQRRHSITEARILRIAHNLPGVFMSFEVKYADKFQPLYVSHQCEHIWGYTAQEIIEDPTILLRAHDPDDLIAMLDAVETARLKLQGFTRRFKITDRYGKIKWLEARLTVTQKVDDLVLMDGLFLDVSQEVEAQRRLTEQTMVAQQAQKNESIGQLTGGVAHDFNNLLAVVLGNIEFLRDELTNPEHIELIDDSIAAIFRGSDLTRNMLAFARKAQLEPKVIDLNKLARDTKNWTGRTLPATILVEVSLLAGLWTVKADPTSTESALLNLILNARDAMPNGGKLTIETANVRIDDEYTDSRNESLASGRYVMLAVSDTGHGIAADKLGSIFEPFFSTKGKRSGSGLGLSMVEGFMRQSGGTVQVYSEPDVGTTFKLFFPAFKGEVDETVITKIAPPDVSKNGFNLLVAEDEPEVLRILVANLEKAGYSVTQAHSGDEAKAIFDADPSFDLLLTDIVMPGDLQGTTLARNLRETHPALPVIFMSGYASEATVHGNGLRPEDVRLMKPVARAALYAALEKSLAGRKLQLEQQGVNPDAVTKKPEGV